MNIIYNYYKSFPCSGEHVRRGLDTRGGYKQARHTHTHTLTHRQRSYRVSYRILNLGGETRALYKDGKLGGSGGMPPRKFLIFTFSEVDSDAFWVEKNPGA